MGLCRSRGRVSRNVRRNGLNIMNLRVDLILESEQRSASVVSLKFVIRLVAIVVPTILALLIVWAVSSFISIKKQVRNAEEAWKDTEPRQTAVQELRAKANVNLAMLQELEGWKKTHVDWNLHLQAVQRLFPKDLQLSSLTLTHVIQSTPKDGLSRQFVIVLKGTAFGSGADQNVQRLRRSIQKSAPFTNILEEAEVKQFEADPQNRNNRLFQVECRYQPRLF